MDVKDTSTSHRPTGSPWWKDPRVLTTMAMLLAYVWQWVNVDDFWLRIFVYVFILRYSRLVGHILGFSKYQPAKIAKDPTYTSKDVTVIVPTVDPTGPDFKECITSILEKKPAVTIIVTVGHKLHDVCREVADDLQAKFASTDIQVAMVGEASKRRQIAHVMPNVQTAITILADDRVFWPHTDFITSVIAPLEDMRVGVVATKKRVRRTTPGQWTWSSIVNFIACAYIERHNWEYRASDAVDNGLYVVSGRTAVYRTTILRDDDLMDRFCHEKFFFGLLGGERGLGPDDDNFLTREVLKNNWIIRFQDTDEALMETTLGEWPKFWDQLFRWARTTIRSNPVMLRDPYFFAQYTWSYFMVYWALILNFALFWDALLICSFSLSSAKSVTGLLHLLYWMVFTKTVKLLPMLIRHPADIPLMIFQIAFGYVHSFIKLWSVLTFWDHGWSGRDLNKVNKQG